MRIRGALSRGCTLDGQLLHIKIWTAIDEPLQNRSGCSDCPANSSGWCYPRGNGQFLPVSTRHVSKCDNLLISAPGLIFPQLQWDGVLDPFNGIRIAQTWTHQIPIHSQWEASQVHFDPGHN